MLPLAYRYKRFHIAYLFGWLAGGILIGLVLGKVWPGASDIVWLVVGLTLLPAAFKSRRWWTCGLILVAGILIGWHRGSVEIIHLQGYDQYRGKQVSIEGEIKDDPQPDKRGTMTLCLSKIEVDGKPLRGSLYISTISKLPLKRGDVLELSGKLRPGFGSYAGAMTYSVITSANSGATPIRDLRDQFSAGVRATVPEPEASLGLGFVVGQRSALPPELDEQLKIVGLTHIVVASGYNLTILVRFARRLLAKYSRYLALAVSLAMVLTFIAFSGLTPSMVRAGLVTVLSLVAWYYGRRFHPVLLILFVACATAYWDPVYVWGDMGWYLSFLAFAGVLIAAPLLTVRFYKEKQPGAIVQLFIETTAAQIITLPLILFTFERLPVLSLLANVLVAPLIPLAMLASTIAGIAGMIAPTILGVLGLPATVSIGYCVAVVETLSGIQWAQIDVSIPAFVLVLMYIVILGLLGYWWKRAGYKFLVRSIVE